MNVIAVDDEKFALEISEQAIKNVLPDCTLFCFTSPSKSLAYAEKNPVDLAFLDIEMGGMNGIVLAKELKEIYGKTNIVFVTGHSEYALDSYTLDTTDYLLKPLSKELVIRAIERLRSPFEIKADKRVRVQTFGNFEVFVDGRPLLFTYAKTKELLAYLVHRKGAMCSNDEIIAVLWEDRTETLSLKSHLRNLVSDLMQMLKAKGLEDMILKKHGHISVVTDKFMCDYYDFFKCVPYAVKSYTGEYMAQYGWAEFINAYIESAK